MRRIVKYQGNVGAGPWIPLDRYQDANGLSVSVNLNGQAATYAVEATLDDIYDPLVTPAVAGQLVAPGTTQNSLATYAFPVAAVRLNLSAYAGPGGSLPRGWYYYVVTALTAAGETTISNEVGIFAGGVGSNYNINEAGLAATQTEALLNANQVVLTWGAVAGATGYRVYRTILGQVGTENQYVALGAVTTYTDTGTATWLTGTPPKTNTATLPAPVQSAAATAATGGTIPAATYVLKVTALDAAGETIGSNEQSITTTGTTSTVTANWAAVTGATSYKVYIGNAGAGSESSYFAAAGGATVTLLITSYPGTAGTVPLTNTATLPTPVQSAPTTSAGGVSIEVLQSGAR